MGDIDRLSLVGLTSSQLATTIGLDREVLVDVDKRTLTLHDGSKPGGYRMLREDGEGDHVGVVAPGATARRTLRDRAGDTLHVRDFEAHPTKSAAANTAAFQKAIDAAPDGSTLLVTRGDFALNESALDFGAKRLRILLDGATINGSFPGAIRAVVEGNFQGGRRSVKSAGAGATDFADSFTFRRADYAGGTPGFVNAGNYHVTEAGTASATYEWGGVVVLQNHSTQDTQNIGHVVQAHKHPGASHTWATHWEFLDYGTDPASAAVISEIGFRANGGDAHGQRVILDLNVARRNGGDGTTPTVSYGIRIGPAHGDPANGRVRYPYSSTGDTDVVLSATGTSTNTWDSAFARDNGTREYGIDLGGADYRSGYALRMRAGHKLALEETGVISLRWNPATARVELLSGATPLLEIGPDGLRVAGPARLGGAAGGEGLAVVPVPSANRRVEVYGSNGGNPGIGTSGGDLALAPAGTVRVPNNKGIVLDGASGGYRLLALQTAGVARWNLGATAGAEGGANSGSDFFMHRFNDDGSFGGVVIEISRATGRMKLPSGKLSITNLPTSPTGLSTGDLWNDGGALKIV